MNIVEINTGDKILTQDKQIIEHRITLNETTNAKIMQNSSNHVKHDIQIYANVSLQPKNKKQEKFADEIFDSKELQEYNFVKNCLKGKSILFIGDSLTRYQYLNLVHYIATDKWSSTKPRNEIEIEHESWTAFYKTTTSRNIYEKCDCYRSSSKPNLKHIVENRYFEYNNIKITYMQYFTRENGIKFHDLKWLSSACLPTGKFSCQTGCKPGYCEQEIGIFKYLGDILAPGVFEEIIEQVNATDIILNVGLHYNGWLGVVGMPSSLGNISRQIESSKKNQKIKFHWKTTTKPKISNLRIQEELNAAENLKSNHGWKVFDLWNITNSLSQQYNKSIYWDNLHFEPWIYPLLNTELIRHICQVYD